MSERVGIVGSFAVRPEHLADDWHSESVRTPYGDTPVLTARIGNTPVVYLTRSAGQAGVAPHLVRYRAVVEALRELGIRQVLATSVAGSLSSSIPPGSFVVLDQFLDFTRARITTLFGGDAGFANTDITDPYCPRLRNAMLSTDGSAIRLLPHGCYVGVDGPRYETRAEVEMYRRLGGDVVGMTGLPEVVLAREAGICWASLAIVSNMAAGLVQGPVSRKEHAEKVAELSTQIGSVLRQAVISSANSDGLCACSTAVTDFVRGNGRPRRTEADEERTLVLLRPTVLQNRQVGSVVAVLEGVAGILGIKSVVFDDELIQAIYDRPGIANLLPGIKDAHVGKKGIAIALVGPQGTCNVVEAEVEKIRAALATDALHNGLHASGDSATAERELALIFSEKELVVPGSHRIGA